jgi:hypothetical protein
MKILITYLKKCFLKAVAVINNFIRRKRPQQKYNVLEDVLFI